MADEIFLSVSANSRLAETLNANIMLKLIDRGWLWHHPALMRLSDANGSSSDTVKTPILGMMGFDNMTSVAESASSVNVPLLQEAFTVTIGRQALQRQISDLNDIVDSTGAVSVEGLANDGMGSAFKRFTDLIATAGAGFTTTVGTTTVAMTTDDFYDATFALEQASVEGPWISILFPKQWTDLRESMRSEGGALQFQDSTASLLDLKGQGFKGSFLGVDIYASALVPTANAGADSAGSMFGQGAIAYREGSRTSIPGVGEVRVATPLYTTLDYDVSGALTTIVHNYFVGVSVSQDAMGVAIITDR